MVLPKVAMVLLKVEMAPPKGKDGALKGKTTPVAMVLPKVAMVLQR
jgi:hypothetical protein